MTTSLVPVPQVSLRRIKLGVKSLLRGGSYPFEEQRHLVIERPIWHLPPKRDLNKPAVRWMMEEAIEGDQGPISVIDLMAREFDRFVAVT